jgi:adenylate cyclase
LLAAHGYSGFQVNDVYLRAQSLNQALGESPNPAILRGLVPFYLVHRAFSQSQVLGEEILALASQSEAREDEDREDPVLYVEGHYVLGVTAFWCGEFVQSKGHLEKALSRYDVHRHELHTTLYTQDPGVVCLVRLAHVLWYLGYPEEAQRRNMEALTLAHKFGHPFTLAYALFYTAMLYNECWNAEATAVTVDDLTNHCRQYAFKYWQSFGLVIQGHLLVNRGEIDAGIAQIRAGIIAHHSSGDDFYRPYALAMLAQAYIKAGAPEDARAALDEALDSIVQYGDHWYEAELLRLKGELLATLATDESTVEAHFQQALTLAQSQQAKSLELRAALSLARWWVRQGKRDAASLLLRGVYDWFSEGFSMPDLKEAKAFLDELS